MRDINVWAYHVGFGTLCKNAQLDKSTGLRYPSGNKQGQVGWHVAVKFKNLHDLAEKFAKGIPMPRQFCGNWFSDCDPIKRGEVVRLAILAHGDKGGEIFVNGKSQSALTAKTVNSCHQDLHKIGLMTRKKGSTILLMGCLAGYGDSGTRLLIALSGVWPGRKVVGFSTIGYRHPGEMRRRGEPCELPGMRDTEATDYLFANPHEFDKLWKNFYKMPWASESSRHAKVVVNSNIKRCPEGELCKKPKSGINLSPFEKRLGTQRLATAPGRGSGRIPRPIGYA